MTSTTETKTIVVKTFFNGDVRRFSLPDASFENLARYLAEVYSTLPKEFSVKYTDEENEEVSISTKAELAEALRVAGALQGKVLKLTVVAKAGAAPATPKAVAVDTAAKAAPAAIELPPTPTAASTPVAAVETKTTEIKNASCQARRFHGFRGFGGHWAECQKRNAEAAAAAGFTAEQLKADFVADVTVADGSTVAPSTTFTKTWSVRNTGSAAWPDCKLIFKRGARELVSGEEFSVPTAAAGATVEISVPMKAPTAPGRYRAVFRIADRADRFKFGPKLWVDFVVAEPKVEAKEELKTPSAPAAEAPAAAPVAAEPKAEPKPVEVKAPAAAAPVETKTEAPKPAAAKPASPITDKWALQLNALAGMGFTNTELNVYLLERNKGNLQATVNWLVEKVRA